MTSLLDISNINLEKIELSRDKTHHLYNDIPLYDKKFDLVMSFHPPGVAAAKDKSGWYHIDVEGKPIYLKRFLKTFGFYDGIAAVVDESGCYHIDIYSNPIYDERYEWVGNIQEERCPVRDDKRNYFHIRMDGTLAYDKKYKYVGDFKYGIAVVYNDNGFAQHIDKSGNLIHDKKYSGLGLFHKGFSVAKDNRGAFHINKKGEPLYKERYQGVEPFYNGFAFACRKNGEKVIINKQGEIIHEIYNQDSTNIQNSLRKQLMGMLIGYWKTQIIHSIVELGILDLIKTGEKKFKKLLKITRLPVDSLRMIIQVLKIWDFIEEKDGFYKLKFLGNLLTEDHPNSLKHASLMWGDEHYLAMSKLTDALKYYKPQFQEIFGKPLFKYFNSHPDKGIIYNKAIKAYSFDYNKLIESYDFTNTRVIMEIGGGTGQLLEKIISQNSTIQKGILFELPSVVREAKKQTQIKSLNQKIEFIPGDFFGKIPIKADMIIISRVLHDWNDENTIKILRNIYDALEQDGKLLILEMIVPENPEYDIGVTLNFNLLVNVGGKERTLREFEDILQKTGFIINSVKSSEGIISMIITDKINNKKGVEMELTQ